MFSLAIIIEASNTYSHKYQRQQQKTTSYTKNGTKCFAFALKESKKFYTTEKKTFMKFQFKISYVARIAHKTIYGGAGRRRD
jgi:hypothetical protein